MAIVDRRTSALPVPHAMVLADRVPKERYYDPEFFAREAEQLWPRVWQMACRLEEIPEPFDFTEYQILDQSVVVVRTRTWASRRSRTPAATGGSGSRSARGTCESGFTCPFHGWRYGPDGVNVGVPRRKSFAEHNLHSRRPRPGAGAVRDLGRLRLDQPRPRRTAAAREPRALRHQPRRLEGRVAASRVVVRLSPAGELEAGRRGVRRGVPRSPDPPAAHHPDAVRAPAGRQLRRPRVRRRGPPVPAGHERGHGRDGPRERRARRRAHPGHRPAGRRRGGDGGVEAHAQRCGRPSGTATGAPTCPTSTSSRARGSTSSSSRASPTSSSCRCTAAPRRTGSDRSGRRRR